MPNTTKIHLIDTLKWFVFSKKTSCFPNLKDFTTGFYQTYFPNQLLLKKKKKKKLSEKTLFSLENSISRNNDLKNHFWGEKINP